MAEAVHVTDRLGSMVRQARSIFLGKAFFFCGAFITSVILARLLGAESLGKYQLGLVVVQITTIFCVIGFDKGLMRYLPLFELDTPGRIRRLLASNLLITLALSLFFSLLIYLSAPLLANYYFKSEAMASVLRTFSLYVPVFALFRLSSGAVTGCKRADIVSHVQNVLTPATFFAALLFVAFFEGGLVGCIQARIITHLVGALVLLFYLARRYRPSPREDEEEKYTFGSYLSFSTPLMLMGLIYFLLAHLDIIMLGAWVPEREIGLYSVAAKLALLVIVGLEVVLPIIGPHFSELARTQDNRTISVLFKTSTKWIFYCGLIVFGLLAVLRFEALEIFGDEFSDASTVLLILLAGQLVNALTGPTGQLLIMTGKHRWELANTVVVLGLNLVLNLALIPVYGAIGAALATAGALMLINLAKLVEVYYLLSLTPYGMDYLKGVVGVIFAGLACHSFRSLLVAHDVNTSLSFLLGSVLFCVVFIGSLTVLGFDADDRQLARMFFRGVQQRGVI